MVISHIRATLSKSTNSLLVHLVPMVMSWQVTEEPFTAAVKQSVPESVLSKIPKEWNYTPLDGGEKETNTNSRHRPEALEQMS